jgi:hypothetical protein
MDESSLYFIFSPKSLSSSDVYRHESGRSPTLPFSLTFFIISPFRFSFDINDFPIKNRTDYLKEYSKIVNNFRIG